MENLIRKIERKDHGFFRLFCQNCQAKKKKLQQKLRRATASDRCHAPNGFSAGRTLVIRT
jgi:hypothetical protein